MNIPGDVQSNCKERGNAKIVQVIFEAFGFHFDCSIVKICAKNIASKALAKTCDKLRLRLALLVLAMACDNSACVQFDRAQICTQVNASFSPFGHTAQFDACWS